jgi:hypothetical protein
MNAQKPPPLHAVFRFADLPGFSPRKLGKLHGLAMSFDASKD